MVKENVKFRELASNGPKYLEPNKINSKATEKSLFESIDLYAERRAKQNKWISGTSLNGKTDDRNGCGS